MVILLLFVLVSCGTVLLNMMYVQITRTMSLIRHCGWVLSSNWGGLAQWSASRTTAQGVPGSRPGRSPLEQVTFTPCLCTSGAFNFSIFKALLKALHCHPMEADKIKTKNSNDQNHLNKSPPPFFHGGSP